MGKMKELYSKYADEWDDHDCKANDPDDACSCQMYRDFEHYANERYMQDMQDLEDKCLNTDEECEDCGEINCGGEIIDCDVCGYSHCEFDPHCPANHKPIGWTQLMNQNQSDPQDPPTWNQINTDPNDDTIPIDLTKVDDSKPGSCTIRKLSEMDKLRDGNAGKSVGEQCWRCKGLLQQLGNKPPFCGKCELELEKK